MLNISNILLIGLRFIYAMVAHVLGAGVGGQKANGHAALSINCFGLEPKWLRTEKKEFKSDFDFYMFSYVLYGFCMIRICF